MFVKVVNASALVESSWNMFGALRQYHDVLTLIELPRVAGEIEQLVSFPFFRLSRGLFSFSEHLETTEDQILGPPGESLC